MRGVQAQRLQLECFPSHLPPSKPVPAASCLCPTRFRDGAASGNGITGHSTSDLRLHNIWVPKLPAPFSGCWKIGGKQGAFCCSRTQQLWAKCYSKCLHCAPIASPHFKSVCIGSGGGGHTWISTAPQSCQLAALCPLQIRRHHRGTLREGRCRERGSGQS